MAQKIQVKRGLQEAVSNLVLSPGEIAVALDTGNVYIGITSGNYWVNLPAASADTAKTLETAREFSLTDAYYEGLPIADGSITLEL